MTANKPRKKVSITQTTEYGYYIRKKTRTGKKRRQKTIRPPRNPEKVCLAQLKELEFYVYPKNHPDKVFIGIYPLSTYIEYDDLKRLWGILNKIRWYLREDWTKQRKQTKAAKYSREAIVRAYNAGLSRLKEFKTSSPNIN